jgi:glutamine amidotransferase
MCIAIYKPAGKRITKRTLRHCFTANPDGAGMMFIDSNRGLTTHKGFFSFRSFYKQFRDYEREFPDSHFVLHCRIATSGKINTNGCHPHRVSDNLAFVHNGVFINFSTIKNKGKSDTQLFNEKILKKLPPNFLQIPELRKGIYEYCTAGFSKLVFMDGNGKVTIFNEKAGSWLGGVWYSNKLITYTVRQTSNKSKLKDTAYDTDGGSETYASCEICGLYHKEKSLTEYGVNKILLCDFCLTDVCTTPEEDIICPFCGNNARLEEGLCSQCLEYIPPDERMNAGEVMNERTCFHD